MLVIYTIVPFRSRDCVEFLLVRFMHVRIKGIMCAWGIGRPAAHKECSDHESTDNGDEKQMRETASASVPDLWP